MLGVASLGVVLAFVDATIVNVAFPDIREDFDNAGLDELSWILNAYNIVFAAFLIAAGRFADLLGRRKLFTGGVALFTAASMLCAIAPSIELLIVARIVQGVGAAIIVPASLALVIEAYRGPDQSHGVALWSASAALAAGIGPSLGGVLVELGGWRLAFLVNLPIGVAAFVLAGRVLVESRVPGRRRMPDLQGALVLAVGTAAVTLAIVRGNHWGWADARTLGTFAVGAALSAIFAWRCTWHRAPMIDIELVRIRAIAISNGLMFVAAAGYFAYILCNVLFLTSVWDYSVLEAGLALTPGPFVAAAVARPAGSFAERVGERWVLAAGCAIWSSGVLYMAGVVGTTPDFLGEWLAGMVILGLGAGITFPVLGSVTVAPAPGGRFATASGLSAVSRQLGAALGVALLVAIIGTPAPAELAAVFDDGWYFAGACFGFVALGALTLGRIEPAVEEDSTLPPRERPLRPATEARAPIRTPTRQAAPRRLNAVAALRSTPVFAGLDPEILERLVAHASVVSLKAGEWLFRQGEPADALYALVAGRLEVVLEGDRETLLNVKHPGGVIGELALLSGAGRSASVRARRDSRLLRLRRADFERVLEDEPAVQRALMATMAAQLAQSVSVSAPSERAVILALVAVNDAAPLQKVAATLEDALSREGPLVRLDSGGTTESEAAAIVESCERSGSRMLLVAGKGASEGAWRAFCLRQADRILALAAAGPVPAGVQADDRLRGCDLLFYGGEPGTMAGWLDALAPARRQVLDPGALRPGVESVARRLAGRSVGLVLSGGGARALAHVGVIEELADAGVVVDRVASVSIGSFIAALFASGMTPEEIDACCYEEWVRRKPLGDYGIPRHSLIRGERARAMLDRNLHGNIEDLAIDFACSSADLRSGEEVIFRRGSLADAVASSICLPGLGPPQRSNGRLLVDGALISALPVGLLSPAEGPIIAVDVTAGRVGGGQPPSNGPAHGDGPDRLPSIGETLFRTVLFAGVHATREARGQAELLIVPEAGGIGFLEFHQMDVAKEAGRRAAREALESENAGGVLAFSG